MEEKYITKLLTFSDENLMGNVETISLTRKNVKELLNELHKNYIPISVIEKKIKTLDGALDYIDIAEYSISTITDQIDVLQELLDERNNTDDT